MELGAKLGLLKCGISEAHTGLGKYEEALASANRAIGIAPHYAQARSDRSVLLWYLKQYDAAIASVQQALKLDPDLAQAWINQATILRTLDDYSGALHCSPTTLL